MPDPVEPRRGEAGDRPLGDRAPRRQRSVTGPPSPSSFSNANSTRVASRAEDGVGLDHVALLAVEVVDVAQAGRRARCSDQPPSAEPSASSTPSGTVPSGTSTVDRDAVCDAVPHVARPPARAPARHRGSSGTWSRAPAVAAGGWDRVQRTRLSSGSTSLRRASSHHSSTISASRSGCSRGQVVGLGEVLGDVVELPHVVVERRVGVRARRRTWGPTGWNVTAFQPSW